MSRSKFVLFSLLPALLLMLLLEGGMRLLEIEEPELRTLPFYQERVGLLRPDPELFWGLTPGMSLEFLGEKVSINSLGMRGPEPGSKAPGEVRILSLGESSTFGVGVSDGETYSALLPELLESLLPGATVTVLNAGVSAYSSFQSLKLLENRGLALEPDVVLFYHEVNDYLPSTLRDSSSNQLGMSRTDRQHYESRSARFRRLLAAHSAVFRFAALKLATRRVRGFRREREGHPLDGIGLPDIGIPSRVFAVEEGRGRIVELDEKTLSRRVSESERKDNIETLAALCAGHGIRLLVIHPSYRDSVRHECLLTRTVRRLGVPMLEAHDALHPAGHLPGAAFLDSWHPGPAGHRRLAEAAALRVAALLRGDAGPRRGGPTSPRF